MVVGQSGAHKEGRGRHANRSLFLGDVVMGPLSRHSSKHEKNNEDCLFFAPGGLEGCILPGCEDGTRLQSL